MENFELVYEILLFIIFVGNIYNLDHELYLVFDWLEIAVIAD